MKKFKLITLLTVLFSVFAMTSCNNDDDNMRLEPHQTASYAALNNAMHKLWSDHMVWTYATVDAFFHDQASLNGKLTRLLQNQQDIGNAIKPYYGNEAGDMLAALLTEHIELAVPVLTAAQNGDNDALGTALEDWYANADDIAHFLSGANPENWPNAEMEHMMAMHIDQTVDYSVKLLQNDTEAAIASFDEAFAHMMEMADDLSMGIAKQFPHKFVQ